MAINFDSESEWPPLPKSTGNTFPWLRKTHEKVTDHAASRWATSDLTPTESMEEESLPGMEEESLPGMEEESLLGMEEESVPGMEEESLPGMEEESLPGMEEESLPGMEEESLPGMDEHSASAPFHYVQRRSGVSSVDWLQKHDDIQSYRTLMHVDEEVAVQYKPVFGYISTEFRKDQVGGGRPQKGCGIGRPKKGLCGRNLAKIAQILHANRYANTSWRSCSGVWARVCKALSTYNTLDNRRRLHAMWLSKKGAVKHADLFDDCNQSTPLDFTTSEGIPDEITVHWLRKQIQSIRSVEPSGDGTEGLTYSIPRRWLSRNLKSFKKSQLLADFVESAESQYTAKTVNLAAANVFNDTAVHESAQLCDENQEQVLQFVRDLDLDSSGKPLPVMQLVRLAELVSSYIVKKWSQQTRGNIVAQDIPTSMLPEELSSNSKEEVVRTKGKKVSVKESACTQKPSFPEKSVSSQQLNNHSNRKGSMSSPVIFNGTNLEDSDYPTVEKVECSPQVKVRKSKRLKKPVQKRDSWIYPGLQPKKRKRDTVKGTCTECPNNPSAVDNGFNTYAEELSEPSGKENFKSESSNVNFKCTESNMSGSDDHILPLKKRRYVLDMCTDDIKMSSVNNTASLNMDHSYVAQETDNISESGTVSDMMEEEETVGNECAHQGHLPNGQLDIETIGDILGEDIPQHMFTHELPSTTSFLVNSERWIDLFRRKKGKCLPAGEWQPLFVDGIKESNMFCVFNFKRHRVSSCKKQGLLFQANAACKFVGCPVEVQLKMNIFPIVDVTYSGNVNHHIKEKNARYIRKGERAKMKEVFKDGKMPSKQYKQAIHKKDTTALVAGNFDGVGRTSSVFQKIASESHQPGRMNKELYESLQEMKKAIDSQKQQVPIVPGFIQDIGLDPVFIHYWNKDGVTLWNKLCKDNVAFLDATGSICRKSLSGAKMLYYELTLQHPKNKHMSLPVAMMVTERQSEPYVAHFLKKFRHTEKSLKGHNNVKQPMQVNTDWSFVMINSVLEAFNRETVQMFLLRSWRILNAAGVEEDFICKTTLHICLSHHMKLMKEKCKSLSTDMKYFGMYFMSLLIRCETLQEAEDLLFHGSIVLATKFFSEELSPHVRNVFKKINVLRTEVPNTKMLQFEPEESSVSAVPQEPEVSLNETEEDALFHAATSPFKEWFRNINLRAQKVVSTINNKSNQLNKYYCPQYLEKVLEHYIPTFPLWSNVLLPHNHKLKDIYVKKGLDVNRIPIFNHEKPQARTQGTIEQRFKVLKCLEKCGNQYMRLDDFSHNLQEHTEAAYKTAMLACLKETPSRKKKVCHESSPSVTVNVNKLSSHVTPSKRKVLLQEKWGKKKQTRDCVGVFQTPPKKLYRTGDSFTFAKSSEPARDSCSSNISQNFSGLPNLGFTCWFNAFLQAISKTKIADAILALRESFVVEIQDSQIFLDCVEMVKHGNEDLSRRQMEQILYGTPNTRSPSCVSGCINTTYQQDVSEFYFVYFTQYFQTLKPRIEYTLQSTCCSCNKGNTATKRDTSCHLYLDVPSSAQVGLSIQTLSDNTASPETVVMNCSCGSSKKHRRQTFFTDSAIPSLFLMLKRFIAIPGQSFQLLRKNQVEVDINMTLTFGKSRFTLKSLVVHKGSKLSGGHYYSVVLTNCNGKVYLTVCDDCSIETAPFSGTWSMEVKRNCVLLVYDVMEESSQSQLSSSKTCIAECVLSCMNTISSGRKALEILLRSKTADALEKVNFIKTMQDYSLLQNMKVRTMKAPTEIIQYLEKGMCMTNLDIRMDIYYLLRLQVAHGFKCEQCQYCHSRPFDVGSALSVSDISEDAIKRAIQQEILAEPSDAFGQPCTCLTESDRIIEIVHFPCSLILVHLQPNLLEIEDCQNCLVLTSFIHGMYSHNEVKYKMSSILIKMSDSECNALSFVKKGIFEYLTIYPGKQCTLPVVQSLMKEAMEVYIFYTQIEEAVPSQFRWKSLDESDLTGTLRYCSTAIGYQYKDNAKNRMSVESWNRLKSRQRWFNAEVIDVYMQLISKTCTTKKVKFMASGWLNQRYFYDSDPNAPKPCCPATLQLKWNWFDQDIILVPVNVGDDHWTLYVVDIPKKYIYVCDSMKGVYHAFIVKLIRCLATEYTRKHLQVMNAADFQYINYSEQEDFPVQKDSCNCGTYVCIMAKCIVFERKFSFHQAARETIRWELHTGQLIA